MAPQDTPRTLFSEMPRAEPPLSEGGGPYRSLSLLAMAGFALAILAALAVVAGGLVPFAMTRTALFFTSFVLFPAVAVLVQLARGQRDAATLGQAAGLGLLVAAVLFGIGGLMAYSGSNPWMLGLWFWIVVVLALLVCVVARVQIHASEGTLTGAPLARWGMTVAAFFGLIYLAYESSISLAVSSQARTAALEYIDLLKRGEVVSAFLRTLPPERRRAVRSGQNALEMVEKGYNVVHSIDLPGDFSGFCIREEVRLLRLAGEDLKATEKSCRSEVTDKACRVKIVYQITSRLVSFELGLLMVGMEYIDPENGVRQRGWRVELGSSGVEHDAPTVLEDAAGPLLVAHVAAKKLAERWLAAIDDGDIDTAFLLMLPKERRTGKAREAALKSPLRAEFGKGTLLDIKDGYFPDSKTRAAALANLRTLFRNRAGERRSVELFLAPKVAYPVYVVKDGSVLVGFDVRGTTRLETGRPKYYYEFGLVVEGPYADVVPAPDDFRIASLRFERVKELAVPQK